MASNTFVYLFQEGRADQKNLLGGKGANLAEMTKLGLPVPPGLTVTTEACKAYIAGGEVPAGMMEELKLKLKAVEKSVGRTFGDAENPFWFRTIRAPCFHAGNDGYYSEPRLK